MSKIYVLTVDYCEDGASQYNTCNTYDTYYEANKAFIEECKAVKDILTLQLELTSLVGISEERNSFDTAKYYTAYLTDDSRYIARVNLYVKEVK